MKQPRWEVIIQVHINASGYAIGLILAHPKGRLDYLKIRSERIWGKRKFREGKKDWDI